MAAESDADRRAMAAVKKIASGWDMLTMFNDFAITFVYKSGGVRYTLNGIYDDAYQGVNVADAEFSSTQPMITLPTKALPFGAAAGDRVIMDCGQFIVTDLKADGTGVTVLMLEETTNLDAP